MESKTESKLRLDFFLAQGLELINSDVTIGPSGNDVTIGDDNRFNWNLKSHIDKECFINSLAPRENKGVQPVGDDVVVDIVFGFHSDTVAASSVHWSMKHGALNVKTWKPNLDALIELQEKPKVTQVKPEVVGYVQTGYKGVSFCGSHIHSKKSMASTAIGDFQGSDIKPKFRPVYKKRDTHHSK